MRRRKVYSKQKRTRRTKMEERGAHGETRRRRVYSKLRTSGTLRATARRRVGGEIPEEEEE
jgi:hypothetical protein